MSSLWGQVSHHERLVETGVAPYEAGDDTGQPQHILLAGALGTFSSQKHHLTRTDPDAPSSRGSSPVFRALWILSCWGGLFIYVLKPSKYRAQWQLFSGKLSVLPFSFNFVGFLPFFPSQAYSTLFFLLSTGVPVSKFKLRWHLLCE